MLLRCLCSYPAPTAARGSLACKSSSFKSTSVFVPFPSRCPLIVLWSALYANQEDELLPAWAHVVRGADADEEFSVSESTGAVDSLYARQRPLIEV